MRTLWQAAANLAGRLGAREGRLARTSLVEMAEFPEMNPGPVLRLDLEGVIVRANAAARNVFADEDLLGTLWSERCPEMTAAQWAAVLESAEPTSHEAMIGDRCIVFTYAHRAGSEQVFVFGSDVTERRRAEEELRVAHEQVRLLLESTGEGIYGIDLEGNCTFANPACFRLLGYDSDAQLLGRNMHRLVHHTRPNGEPYPEKECRIYRAFRQGTGTHVDDEVMWRADGTSFPTEYWSYPMKRNGELVGCVLTFVDITERRRLEREFGQQEKMATLGTLAAGVAHELNNPSAAAQRAAQQLTEAFTQLQQVELRMEQAGFPAAEREALVILDGEVRERAACACDLSPMERSDRESAIEEWLEAHGVEDPWELAPGLVNLDYEPDRLTEMERTFAGDRVSAVVVWLSRLYPVYSLLEEIRHAAGRLSEIVGALKAYSYVGQSPVQAVEVNQGLRHTLIILRNKLKQGVEVVQELASDLPRIQAYGSELNQVWTNLIDNAVGAMQGTGRLTVRSRLDDDTIAVEIEDDGPGIPEAIQSRIFDAFFTTKPPGEGTGLGLHTTYNIVVNKHCGKIDVASRPGCTRFTVRLPLDGASSAGPTARGAE